MGKQKNGNKWTDSGKKWRTGTVGRIDKTPSIPNRSDANVWHMHDDNKKLTTQNRLVCMGRSRSWAEDSFHIRSRICRGDGVAEECENNKRGWNERTRCEQFVQSLKPNTVLTKNKKPGKNLYTWIYEGIVSFTDHRQSVCSKWKMSLEAMRLLEGSAW